MEWCRIRSDKTNCDHRKQGMTGGEKEQYSAVRCEG